MKIRPAPDRVVLKPAQRELLTKGGIVIPDSVRDDVDRPIFGEILAIGPHAVAQIDSDRLGSMTQYELESINRLHDPFKVGELAMVNRHAGSKVTLDGEEFLVVDRTAIIGVVEK